MKLQTVSRSRLNLRPFNWAGVSRRFMNTGELETLIALVASVRPRTVLEFGVNAGRTAKAILDCVPGIVAYEGIDVLPGYVTEKLVQRREIPEQPGALVLSDPRFRLVLRSRGSLDLQACELQACDVAFIDGDHGRAAVTHDTMLARQLVRPGGMIIWHDYHDLGNVDVCEVLHEQAAAGAPIVAVQGTWLAFERVPLQAAA